MGKQRTKVGHHTPTTNTSTSTNHPQKKVKGGFWGILLADFGVSG